MMRLPSGKMSSRTGNVIGGEDMLEMISEKIREKVTEMRVSDEEKEKLVNDIAVGAIKFSILKIAPGKDIAFDFDKSISFEGDSGPYLQYTHARLSALLDKAIEQVISFEYGYVVGSPERELEKVIMGYHEVLEKTYRDLGPQHVVQHLLLLTRVFNSLYARVQIVNVDDKDVSSYYVMLATATRNILAHGLYTLGIAAPERM
jgi:arginyl-tRNA synthetase